MLKISDSDYELVFNPEKGMNLNSLKKGDLQIIDPLTQPLFEERFAGLGAVIGPHFHYRSKPRIRSIPDPSAFPFLKNVAGRPDPFSHGIARYVPWQVFSQNETSFEAQVKGADLYKGIKLSDLEGQNFVMTFKGKIENSRIKLNLSVVSDTDSIVGFHYYYRLPDKKGVIVSEVQKETLDHSILKPIPAEWGFDGNKTLRFQLDKEADYTFHPFHKLKGNIELITSEYNLKLETESKNEENSFQIYHPQDASYACIEPLSAFDPLNPHLSVSEITLYISIETL